MNRTCRPARGILIRSAACGLALAGALTLPVCATAQSGLGSGTSAWASGGSVSLEQPGALSSQVTDDLGILDSSQVQSVLSSLESEYHLRLWVVTYSDPSATAVEIDQDVWQRNSFGRNDALLLINMPDGVGQGGSFSFARDSAGPVSDSQYQEIQEGIETALKDQDWNGAVEAVSVGMGGSSGSTGTGSSLLPVGVGLLAVGAVGAVVVSRRRRTNSGRRGAPGSGQADPPTIEELRLRAGNALVAADDAVRAAAEELSYAQAQFGLSATDAFTAALTTGQENLARSFELRQLLEDDVPETEAQQRQMYREILERCTAAVEAIRAQEKAFSARRGIEANLPTSISETAQRTEETSQAIVAARRLLVTLHATYPDSSLSSVDEAPDRAEQLLEASGKALEQARASVSAGQQATAVEQVRIAQGSLAQAAELVAQVSGARERLERAASDLQAAITSISSDLVDAKRLGSRLPAATLDPLVRDAEAAVSEGHAASGRGAAGDPLSALDHLARAEAALDSALAPVRAQEENDSRARATLGSRLSRLSAQIEAVTSYITTHRGAVGSSARTALSEATRHAAAATAMQPTDPASAMTEVATAESLVAQAQALAEADVRSAGPWSQAGGYGAGPRGGGSGINLGSLILGGILLGGNNHRGGYGGWGGHHDRGWGGGGFSGGGGGFGGGGFDGGGGSF